MNIQIDRDLDYSLVQQFFNEVYVLQVKYGMQIIAVDQRNQLNDIIQITPPKLGVIRFTPPDVAEKETEIASDKVSERVNKKEGNIVPLHQNKKSSLRSKKSDNKAVSDTKNKLLNKPLEEK
jgi:hypothetical protein